MSVCLPLVMKEEERLSLILSHCVAIIWKKKKTILKMPTCIANAAVDFYWALDQNGKQ